MAAPHEETVRLHQANERTMLAWIRTGIALMTFGFAIARFGVFLREIAAAHVLAPAPEAAGRGMGSVWTGGCLVTLGMVANLLATVRYARVRRAILRGDTGAPNPVMVYGLGIAATLIGVAMVVLLVRSLGQ